MPATTPSGASAAQSPQADSAFDQRIVELEIVLPGGPQKFQNLAIYAAGQKFFSPNSSACECRVFNLTREQRNQIITMTSPLKQPRTPVLMNLRVGRVSYGAFLLFTGQVILADVLQPPDIGVVLRSLANNFLTGAIQAVQFPANAPVSAIAQDIATRGGWNLNNQCTDKTINNFSYTGTPLDGVTELNQMGNIQACVDNGTLIVADANKALKGEPYLLSASTGMVGIPQVTDQGVIVKMMINNVVQIGGSVKVESVTNPAANGTYKIMQMHYEVASRDTPFYYTLICSNLGLYNGTQG